MYVRCRLLLWDACVCAAVGPGACSARRVPRSSPQQDLYNAVSRGPFQTWTLEDAAIKVGLESMCCRHVQEARGPEGLMASGGVRRAGGQRVEGAMIRAHALSSLRAGARRAGAATQKDTVIKEAPSLQNQLCGIVWRAARAVVRLGVEVWCWEPIGVLARVCGRICAERWEGGAGSGDARGGDMPLVAKKGSSAVPWYSTVQPYWDWYQFGR